MSDELIEIRCLWLKTDYGYIDLVAAARSYGGQKLGSYQDAVTDKRFAMLRDHHSGCRLVESVLKVAAVSVEALFTDGTEIQAADKEAKT